MCVWVNIRMLCGSCLVPRQQDLVCLGMRLVRVMYLRVVYNYGVCVCVCMHSMCVKLVNAIDS